MAIRRHSKPKFHKTNAAETKPFKVSHTPFAANLYLSDLLSDVTFIVEKERIPAHKVIVASSGEYFRKLLYGGMLESTSDEINLNVMLKPFKLLLKYVYTGNLELEDDVLFDVFDLAHLYGFEQLESQIVDHLAKSIRIDNVLLAHERAFLYDIKSLAKICGVFVDQNATDVFMSDHFSKISKNFLCDLLRRDSLFIDEIRVFEAVCGWYKTRESLMTLDELKEVLAEVRFPLMDLEEIMLVVEPTKFIGETEIIEALKAKCVTPDKLRYRTTLKRGINVATVELDAQVVSSGHHKSNLFHADSTITSHRIDDDSEGIIVQLGRPYLLNSIILFNCHDGDEHFDSDDEYYCSFYSFHIDISLDKEEWNRVWEESDSSILSTEATFAPQSARYIRIKATKSHNNRKFVLTRVECKFAYPVV